MIEKHELWTVAERMSEPLLRASQGTKCLLQLCEAFSDPDAEDILNFVVTGLREAVEELDEAHSGLYRLMQQDRPSTEPTPLHSA